MATSAETSEIPKAVRRVYDMSFGIVYPAYVAKAEKKGRTKREVDEVIRWMTGYTQRQLMAKAKQGVSLERFVDDAPMLNPDRSLITGVVCGVRVEEVEDPILREVRYLDKLIDELAKGKPMETILRTAVN
ncbi:MAG: DUF2200 domain-containing protein [Actinomycetota bacterium]